MKKNLFRIIIIILLIVGIAADAFLLIRRVGSEMDDRSVVSAVYYPDIVKLSRESGLSEQEWLSTLSQSGVRYLIFMTQPEAELLSYIDTVGMEAAAQGDLEGDWAFVVPLNGLELPDLGSTPLVIMKNKIRSTNISPKYFDIETFEGEMIKGVYMYRGFFNRYRDDIRGEEIVNVLYRAITDRGARLLLLRPITYKDFALVLDPEVYTEVLTETAERIAERGFSYGESWSTLEAEVMSPLILWLTGLVPVALWLILLSRFNFLRKLILPLTALGLLGTAVAIYIMPELAQKLLAFGCASGFSFLLIRFMYEFFLSGEPKLGKPLPSYLIALAALLLWGLLGGLSVAAIQTDLSYLYGQDIFSGVKLSMALPLVVCALVFALPIFRRVWARDYSRREILAMLPVFVIILAAALVIIRRSGDTGKDISKIENSLRVALEYTFYARPRTKELFIAVPFMALMFLPGLRRDSVFRLVGALCCTVECTSLINSFCHGLAPIHVSLIRGASAAVVGAVLGIIVLGVFVKLKKKLNITV